MGEADVILGIKLIRSTDGITISQSHYVEKIIEKFGYQNNRIAKTPYDSSVALFKNESGVSVAQLRYSKLLGVYSIWQMARDQIFHFLSLSWLDTLVVLTKPIGVLWIGTKVPEGHSVTSHSLWQIPLFLRDIVMLAG
ncbi:UNVERIFIED_CONTAM: hypothetical protein Sangu_1859600 [Sesamum angustifolium]|uniref:Zinc finger, CCHC-type n=1 Tax=Sesamum angustifolium TaxID=2727405 RepID=A0AAW2MBH5_9LAMI